MKGLEKLVVVFCNFLFQSVKHVCIWYTSQIRCPHTMKYSVDERSVEDCDINIRNIQGM